MRFKIVVRKIIEDYDTCQNQTIVIVINCSTIIHRKILIMSSHLQFKKIALVASMIAMAIFIFASCQQNPPKNSRMAQAERGKALFDKHCTTCHGDNPDEATVAALDKPPPDLALIKDRRAVTEFPVVEMARMIDGRNLVKIHGQRAMPVWGQVFSNDGDDEEAIRGKKGELVAYLMSIQK